jgi:acetolactate synthase-1/2/3 large subunit
MLIPGAEIVVRTLMEQGVTTVFGYPGGAVLALYDALFEHRDKITHYLTAHEQGAAHAADGYARATGKVGVVIATSGPGSTNLVTGIAAAFMDSVPLVAITGNVGSTFIGKDSFQEVYTTGITLPITKHNFFVQDVTELASVLREAFAIASSGRKGPVLVDITKDAQAACCEWAAAQGTAPGDSGDSRRQGTVPLSCVPSSSSTHSIASIRKTEEPSPVYGPVYGLLAPLLEDIAASKRPLVVFGGGVISADASAELRDFIHATRIPAAHSIMGIGALASDDPLNLGLIGMHGRTSANRALAAADLVIALGFRFSDRVALDHERWASQAQIIQVDIDPSEVDKNIEVERAIVADVRAVLCALLDATAEAGTEGTENAKDARGGSTHGPARDGWLSQIAAWRAEDYRPANSDAALRPHQLIEAICAIAGPDVILTTDVGQHQMWAAQYARDIRPRSFLTSGGLGAMGFGYGAAIGAQLGAGGGSTRLRPVIHITGDGSFHMNLNEACTAVSYRLPVITVIFNNQTLGMVRQWQRAFYDAHYSATTLERATDYVKVAEGFGATGMRATTPGEFEAALTRALATEGPVWIECVIDRDEQVLPMIPVGGTVDDTMADGDR